MTRCADADEDCGVPRISAEAVAIFREAIRLMSEPQSDEHAQRLRQLAALLRRSLQAPRVVQVLRVNMDTPRPAGVSVREWERVMRLRRALVAAS
jgi:hypothetical protein